MLKLETFVSAFIQDPELELEMRLGLKTNLESTVLPEYVLLPIYNLLMASAKENIFEFKSETFVDQFYEDSIRCRCVIGPPVKIKKTPVDKCVGICPQRDFAFHYYLKRETPQPDFIMEGRTSIHARIQKIWTFVYKERFAYVVKKVKSGKTREHAAAAKEYEYELE